MHIKCGTARGGASQIVWPPEMVLTYRTNTQMSWDHRNRMGGRWWLVTGMTLRGERAVGTCNDNVSDINSMRYHMNNQVIY